MALAATLAAAGHPPAKIHTTAKVHFGPVPGGFAISRIELATEGSVPGIDAATFEKTATEIYAETVRLGGTVTGEHGVGITSRDVLHLYRPPAFLAAMRAIKLALDPNGILNPGKMLPAAG